MERDYNAQTVKNFIVFEGLDGSGTTTQAKMLRDFYLEKGNISCELTCEPTETFIGEAVRKILRGERATAPGTLAKLFAVDRHNHIYHPEEGILARTKKGRKVICDRYLFSSLAYQSTDRPFEEVWELNRYFPLPEDLVFLDITPEEGERRMDKRGNPREVYEKTELQQEIRENYYHVFSLYSNSGMRIHIFDGSLPQEELAESIRLKLDYIRGSK
ncbi:MAG: dTMP kinase [Sediminispirochaetaceae bacterium]